MMNPVSPDARLVDQFCRSIDYLRVSVTDQCNLKCVYCTPASGARHCGQEELLSSQEIIRAVGAARQNGVRKVRLTGGEPLLRPDIISLIASIKQSAGIHDLSLTTNGMLLAGMAGRLRGAGLDRVNISLDTLDPDRFRRITRGGDIARVLDAIAAAEEAGLYPVKINMVPLRGVNDDEVVDFARLTVDKDMHVRFIECMPSRGNQESRGRAIPSSELRERIARIARLVPLEYRGHGPSRNYRLEGARGVIGFISAVTDHFCGSCNRLRLTATGILRPCLFSEQGVDLKGALRSGADDQELQRLFARAAAIKPSGHAQGCVPFASGGLHAMSQIGG